MRLPNHSSSGSVSLYRDWNPRILRTAEIRRRESPPLPANLSFAVLSR